MTYNYEYTESNPREKRIYKTQQINEQKAMNGMNLTVCVLIVLSFDLLSIL